MTFSHVTGILDIVMKKVDVKNLIYKMAAM